MRGPPGAPRGLPSAPSLRRTLTPALSLGGRGRRSWARAGGRVGLCFPPPRKPELSPDRYERKPFPTRRERFSDLRKRFSFVEMSLWQVEMPLRQVEMSLWQVEMSLWQVEMRLRHEGKWLRQVEMRLRHEGKWFPHEGKPFPHEGKPFPHEGKPPPHEPKPPPTPRQGRFYEHDPIGNGRSGRGQRWPGRTQPGPGPPGLDPGQPGLARRRPQPDPRRPSQGKPPSAIAPARSHPRAVVGMRGVLLVRPCQTGLWAGPARIPKSPCGDTGGPAYPSPGARVLPCTWGSASCPGTLCTRYASLEGELCRRLTIEPQGTKGHSRYQAQDGF